MSDFLLDRDVCAAFLKALGHSVWQALVIGVVATLLCGWLGRERARTRYGVLVIAMLAIVLCVPVTTWHLVREGRAAEADFLRYLVNTKISNWSAGDAARPPDAPGDAPAGVSVFSPLRVRTLEVGSAQLVFGYVAMVLAMLARLVWSIRGGRALAVRALPLSNPRALTALARAGERMGFSYTPAVALCPDLNVPAVVGVLRPVVLLPAAVIAEMSLGHVELVLMHELAHIRRHDQVVELLQRVAEALLFFNPVVWILSNQIRAERECCCDDDAVRAGAKRTEYVQALLEAGRIEMEARRTRARGLRVGGRALALLQAATGQASAFGQRIKRLTRSPGPAQQIRLTRGSALAVCATLFVGVLLPLFLVVYPLAGSLAVPALERRISQEMRSSDAFDGNVAVQTLKDWSLLHRAVVFGSTKEVRMLVESGADVNVRAPRGWAPLHLAACLGREDVAAILIRYGAIVNARNDEGRTPLHVALGGFGPIQPVRPGPRGAVVRLLLNANADPTAADRTASQPIHVAAGCEEGHEFVPDLLAKGADVNAAGPKGFAPLHYACERADGKLVTLLLERGARADALDGQGCSPLHHLAFATGGRNRGDAAEVKRIAQKLVEHLARLDLASATSLGFNDIVKAAVEKDPSVVNVMPKPTRLGFRLLHWAAFSGNVELVRFLLAQRAEVDARATDRRSALHVALGRARPDEAVINALLDAGADVNSADGVGIRPLHLAASWRASSTIKLLRARGADPNVEGVGGKRPLDILIVDPRADLQAELATVRALLEAGASSNAPDPAGLPALHRAVLGGRVALAELLLDFKADPNGRDGTGRTPLMLAAATTSPNSRMVELLIARGADPNLRGSTALPSDGDGTRPVHLK